MTHIKEYQQKFIINYCYLDKINTTLKIPISDGLDNRKPSLETLPFDKLIQPSNLNIPKAVSGKGKLQPEPEV